MPDIHIDINKGESEMIRGCIREEKWAQKKLWDLCSKKLFAVCKRYLNSQEEAEDCFIEAFSKILDKMPTFRSDGSFEGWMRRITVNHCINTIRKNKIVFCDIDLPGNEISYTEDFASDMDAKSLSLLIDKLPSGYKTIFNLYAVEGYKHREISEMLGITEGTSRSQYSKAKKALIIMVNKKYGENSFLWSIKDSKK
jgi:RNA polymerase sigma-70 factor (ECF subfamily)